MALKITYKLNKDGITIWSDPVLSFADLVAIAQQRQLDFVKSDTDIVYSPQQIAHFIDRINKLNVAFTSTNNQPQTDNHCGYKIQFKNNSSEVHTPMADVDTTRAQQIREHYQHYGYRPLQQRYFQENRLIGYTPADASGATAHETFLKVAYPIETATLNWPIHVIYKKNKHGDPHASEIEAAISEVAALFMPPNLTSRASLVRNRGGISGIAIEDIGYAIERRELKGVQYCRFNTHDNIDVTCAEEIPYYFLNSKALLADRGFGDDFFAQLMEKKKNGEVDIDMASLAGILSSAYVLEEDDLHKGNIGFYCTNNKHGKVTYHFFKIDHDLMLAEDYMSYIDPRANNVLLNDQDFAIKTEDLVSFPVVSTGHHYWPTKSVLMRRLNSGVARAAAVVTPSSVSKVVKDATKTYTSSDIAAFSALKDDKEFKRQQWRNMLKHVLIPAEIVDAALSKQLGTDHPDRAELLSIIQARQNELDDALYFNEQFGTYFRDYGASDFQEIKKEIQAYLEGIFTQDNQQNIKTLMEALDKKFEQFEEDIKNRAKFEPNATNPLHTAIARGHYRYGETPRRHDRFINKRNRIGHSPLLIALKEHIQAPSIKPKDLLSNPGLDYMMVFRDLLKRGARLTPQIERELLQNAVNLNETDYIDAFFNQHGLQVKDYQSLQNAISLIGSTAADHNIPRPLQKHLAYELIRRNRHQLSHADLKQFQDDLKNNKDYCKFIRKYFNTNWASRILRKQPYGNTATAQRINQLINKTLSEPEAFGLNQLHALEKGEQIEKSPYKLIKEDNKLNLFKKATIGAEWTLDICVHPDQIARAWSIAGPILFEHQPNNISIDPKAGKIKLLIPPGKEADYQQMIEAVEVALHLENIKRPELENIKRPEQAVKNRCGYYTHITPLHGQKTGTTPFHYMLVFEQAQHIHCEVREAFANDVEKKNAVDALFYQAIMAHRQGDISDKQLIDISRAMRKIANIKDKPEELKVYESTLKAITAPMKFGIEKKISYRLNYFFGWVMKSCGETVGNRKLREQGEQWCQRYDYSRMDTIKTNAQTFFQSPTEDGRTQHPDLIKRHNP